MYKWECKIKARKILKVGDGVFMRKCAERPVRAVAPECMCFCMCLYIECTNPYNLTLNKSSTMFSIFLQFVLSTIRDGLRAHTTWDRSVSRSGFRVIGPISCKRYLNPTEIGLRPSENSPTLDREWEWETGRPYGSGWVSRIPGRSRADIERVSGLECNVKCSANIIIKLVHITMNAKNTMKISPSIVTRYEA